VSGIEGAATPVSRATAFLALSEAHLDLGRKGPHVVGQLGFEQCGLGLALGEGLVRARPGCRSSRRRNNRRGGVVDRKAHLDFLFWRVGPRAGIRAEPVTWRAALVAATIGRPNMGQDPERGRSEFMGEVG